ncbi:MAG: regulatory protein RecX [Oscillospiraceae bacterium]|nr:regulatory protein RecX [Oscillospiraceae bacterium]
MNGGGTLTEIKVTKKGRYALFCAGEFLFSVDEETLLRHHLKEGMYLDGEQWLQIRAASDYQRAKDRAFTYLSMRDHSERELYDKLKKNFDSHTAASTVSRLKELQLLDDSAFGEKLAAELARKGKSRAEAKLKLQEKGIDREEIEGLLEQHFPTETERDAIRTLVAGKYRLKLQKENGRQTVAAALLRRGFKSGDVRAVLSEFTSQEEESFYYE